MKREYTFQEAGKLIEKFKDILKKLSNIDSALETYKSNVIRQAERMLDDKFFQNKQIADFKIQQASNVEYNDSYDLMTLIYRYFESVKMVTYCKELCTEYETSIKECIDKLEPVNNIFSWIFSSRETKDNAIMAYNTLISETYEQFYFNTSRIITKLYSLASPEKYIVLEDVKNNESKYNEIVLKLAPELISYGYKIEDIYEVKEEYNSLIYNLDIIENASLNAKTEIVTAIDKMTADEVIAILKNIPLEELNRDKNGIRIKDLIDYGYNNIAHVYAASINRLISIEGISYQAAEEIKSIANRIAEEAKQNIKIRLSVDNKTIASTRVVRAIYKYFLLNDLLNKKEAIIDKEKHLLDETIKDIEEIQNGIKYYFSTLQEKNEYISKYNLFKKALKEDGFEYKAKNIIDTYKNLENIEDLEAWKDFEKKTVEYYNIIEDLCPGVLGKDDYYYGLPENLALKIQEVELNTDGLFCTLRHYQEIGVKYILHQKKVLLGDEMGLGKTIQAIAAMVSLRNTGATHFLVICPASVVVNWCREIAKHSNLTPIMVHGSSRDESLETWVKEGGVAVTTFETSQHIKLKEDSKYSMLVIDEAHYIKNPDALRTKNAIRLSKHAERMLFMTGTALENNVDEMINLIKVLNPGIANEIGMISYLSTAPKFREKVAPVYYRRKREEVLTELPELIESKEWCIMTQYEQEMYENVILNGSYPEARRLSWHIDDMEQSSKALRLKELIELAQSENRKIIVFSFFLDTIKKVAELLKEDCVGIITGAIDSEARQNIIDEFDKAAPGSVVVSQIIAGGTGLNIQAASVVIICEPQLKPSTENQAISRAYRMGQARNVIVYRLLCENTIDERIVDLLEEKQKIFDTFADKSAAAEMTIEIGEKAFSEIMEEEIKRITEKRTN